MDENEFTQAYGASKLQTFQQSAAKPGFFEQSEELFQLLMSHNSNPVLRADGVRIVERVELPGIAAKCDAVNDRYIVLLSRDDERCMLELCGLTTGKVQLSYKDIATAETHFVEVLGIEVAQANRAAD